VINSFRDGLDRWLSVILKLAFIVAIVLFVMWMGLSVFANATENSGTPKLPSVDKAQYSVFIRATGETLLTDNYDTLGEGSYILHGVYRITDGKWRYQEADLPVSEEYFGPILLRRR
jgi:hypothetical protein